VNTLVAVVAAFFLRYCRHKEGLRLFENLVPFVSDTHAWRNLTKTSKNHLWRVIEFAHGSSNPSEAPAKNQRSLNVQRFGVEMYRSRIWIRIVRTEVEQRVRHTCSLGNYDTH
jgi:hypothetical protein